MATTSDIPKISCIRPFENSIIKSSSASAIYFLKVYNDSVTSAQKYVILV